MISLREAGRVVLFSLLIKSHDNHYIDFILKHSALFQNLKMLKIKKGLFNDVIN